MQVRAFPQGRGRPAKAVKLTQIGRQDANEMTQSHISQWGISRSSAWSSRTVPAKASRSCAARIDHV